MSGYLIIRLKGMGDIVHLIPSLQMLRANHPDSPIGFLCNKPFGQLVPDELHIKKFQITPKAGFSETMAILKAIRRQSYDVLFDLFGNPRTSLLTALSGITTRIGFNYRIRRFAYNRIYEPEDPNIFLSDLFADFFSFFNESGLIAHPILNVKPHHLRDAKAIMASLNLHKPVLGINAHATYPSKAWPHEYFIETAQKWFQKTRSPVLFFWGPGEEKSTIDILSRMPPGSAFTHSRLDIPTLAALISCMDIFLTCDTGPMNISWAVKTPVVALFGPTTRRAVAPRGEQHLILFNKALKCLECHKEVCADGRCMSELTPDYVFDSIREKYPAFFKV